jgi:hypothetical protein
MKIIQHRGQNFPGYMRGSFEIDIRLLREQLICCHDIKEHEEVTHKFRHVLHRWHHENGDMLAINIKEDGLAPYILDDIKREGTPLKKIFCFDMSQAEIPNYLECGLPIATRVSNYGIEKPVGDFIFFDWYPGDSAISFDGLYRQLFGGDYGHLMMGDEKIIAVSPELHGEDNSEVMLKFWTFIKEHKFFGICTDRVKEAEKFFNED